MPSEGAGVHAGSVCDVRGWGCSRGLGSLLLGVICECNMCVLRFIRDTILYIVPSYNEIRYVGQDNHPDCGRFIIDATPDYGKHPPMVTIARCIEGHRAIKRSHLGPCDASEASHDAFGSIMMMLRKHHDDASEALRDAFGASLHHAMLPRSIAAMPL